MALLDKKDVVVDLETLDTIPTAIFPTIGAVLIDLYSGQIEDQFYVNINVAEQAQLGRTKSEATINWWKEQNDIAKQEILKPGIPLKKALKLFSKFIPDHKNTRIWGNGATFDVSILEDGYRMANIPVPWKFWNTRDMRTIVDVSDHLVGKHEIPFEGTQHHALYDAKHEAQCIAAMWQAIKSIRTSG